MIILVIALIVFILFELWTLALACRRNHPYWQILGRFRYAHRGFHSKPRIPENSLPAFRLAIANAYGAELDVHLMKDGHLAVIHDASLKRTAGADVQVEDLTVEELKKYRLEGTDEQIPLLEEVLPLFEDRTPLIVELKSERGNYNELTEATCAMLDKFRVQYCIESFDPRCQLWLRKNRPGIVRGQLSENFGRHREDGAGQSRLTLFALGNLLSNVATRPDFVAYRFADRDSLSFRWCKKFYKVMTAHWTITNKEEMKEAEKAGSLVIFEQFDPRG